MSPKLFNARAVLTATVLRARILAATIQRPEQPASVPVWPAPSSHEAHAVS